METNILMESGTNELEVLEFMVGGNHYGINVAKIKEIVPYSKVTPVPNSHPCVEGVFMPRDLMITIVDLAKVIKCNPSADITKDMFIITKSETGEIRTIDFDPIVVNKTLNKIVNTIQLNLKYLEEGKLELLELPDNVLIDYNEEELSKGVIYEIPSGVVFNNSLLANLGPKIPVKLSLIGDIVSNVNTKVTNYGINNALIEVSIYVQVESRVILPFITDTVIVETEIPVAMKLVQGIVPDYLLGGLTNSSVPIKVPNE